MFCGHLFDIHDEQHQQEMCMQAFLLSEEEDTDLRSQLPEVCTISLVSLSQRVCTLRRS